MPDRFDSEPSYPIHRKRAEAPVIRITRKGRGWQLNVIALKREIKRGTLTPYDRKAAETMCPGICDLVEGKVQSIKIGGKPHA